jgi:hypothetical protein
LLMRVKRQQYNLKSIYYLYKLWKTPSFREITRYADIAIWQGAALWNETRIALNLHGYPGGYRGDCDFRRQYRSLARIVRMLLSPGHKRVLAMALRTTTVVCPWYPWIRTSDPLWSMLRPVLDFWVQQPLAAHIRDHEHVLWNKY